MCGWRGPLRLDPERSTIYRRLASFLVETTLLELQTPDGTSARAVV